MTEVGYGRAAGFDGFEQYPPGVFHDFVTFIQSKFIARPPGIDPGSKERFGGIDIADTGDDQVIHKQIFHRSRAFAALLKEVLPGKSVAQRFDSQMGDRLRNTVKRTIVQFKKAESAGTLKTENITVGEVDKEVFMLASGHTCRFDTHHARHTEVHQKTPVAFRLIDRRHHKADLLPVPFKQQIAQPVQKKDKEEKPKEKKKLHGSPEKFMAKLEREIAAIEEKIKENERLAEEFYADYEKLMELETEKNSLTAQLDEKYIQWEELAEMV